MDRFEVTLCPPLARCTAERRPYRQAHISINGVSLLDLVRAAEVPWVLAEKEDRREEFDDPKGFDFRAGDYHYLPASMVLLPCRQLLDEPADWGFVLEPDDPRRAKATVLGCTCGIIECWFLQVRIELSADTVRWSDFCQFHRDAWVYDLGPFTFVRAEYERQLTQDVLVD